MLYQLKDHAVFGLRNFGSSAQINYFSKEKEGQLQHSHIIKVGYSWILSRYMYIERVVFPMLT